MKIHNLLKIFSLLIATTLISPYSVADDDDDDDDAPSFGLAGLLSKKNREELPKLTLASGQDLSSAPITLRSGGYYVLPIESDGSLEIKFVAIKPGSYYLKIPGSRGDSQRVAITIK